MPEVVRPQAVQDASQGLVVGQGDLVHVSGESIEHLVLADNGPRVCAKQGLGLQVADHLQAVPPDERIAVGAAAQRVDVRRAGPQEVAQAHALLGNPDREVVVVGRVLGEELYLQSKDVEDLLVLDRLVCRQESDGLAHFELALESGIGPLGGHEVVELHHRARGHDGADLGNRGGRAAAAQVVLHDRVDRRVADDQHVVGIIHERAGAQRVVRVAVDDHLDRLVADCLNGLSDVLALFTSVTGVVDYEPVVSLNDRGVGERIAADAPHAVDDLLNRRLHVRDPGICLEDLGVHDGAVGCFQQLDGSTHVARGLLGRSQRGEHEGQDNGIRR